MLKKTRLIVAAVLASALMCPSTAWATIEGDQEAVSDEEIAEALASGVIKGDDPEGVGSDARVLSARSSGDVYKRQVQRKGFHVSVGVFVNNVFAPHDENLGRHKLEKRSFLLGGKRAVYEKEGAAVLIGEGRGGERIGESPSVCDDDGVRRPKPAVFPVVVDLHLGLDAVVAAEPHRALDAGMLACLLYTSRCV